MIQKIFSTTLLAGLLCACTNRNTQDKDAIKISYVHRYGVEVADVDEWRDMGSGGKIVTLTKNGQTKEESYSEGKLHGLAFVSYPYTNICHMQAMYTNGVCDWKVTNYASGVPERKEQYGPGNTRIITAWYEDSLLRMKEEYQDERLLNGQYLTPEQEEESLVSDAEGVRLIRDGHGTLLSKQQIQDGRVTEETRYYPNGMPQAVYPYVHEKIEGIVKTYQVTGEPLTIEEWQEGVPNGEMTIFSNGEPVAVLSYIDGEKEGIEKHYRPGTDEVVEKISWKHGRRYGPTMRFIDNQTITEYYFNDDKVSKIQFLELQASKERAK